MKKPVTGFGNETGFLNVVTNQKAWLTGFLAWCQKSHVHQIEKATVVINSSCTVVVVILILILVVVFVDCFFIVCIRILELL